MNEFKVGDLVKTIEADDPFFAAGDKARVIAVDSPNIHLDFNNQGNDQVHGDGRWCANIENIKLLPPKSEEDTILTPTLTPTDLHFVVSRLPKDVRALMQEHHLIVAGGFIRETVSGGKVSDIDIFGANVETLTLAAKDLTIQRKARMFSTKNAITVLSPPRFPVQFITRWLFETPALCTESFDFTVCQAAVWYDKEAKLFKSVVGKDFYPDLAARRLTYTYPVRDEEAGGSMLRMRKFISRGYSVQAGSMAGIISRLVGKLDAGRVNFSNERAVAKILTGLLREVDPLTVVDGIDFVDEHEIEGVENV